MVDSQSRIGRDFQNLLIRQQEDVQGNDRGMQNSQYLIQQLLSDKAIHGNKIKNLQDNLQRLPEIEKQNMFQDILLKNAQVKPSKSLNDPVKKQSSKQDFQSSDGTLNKTEFQFQSESQASQKQQQINDIHLHNELYSKFIQDNIQSDLRGSQNLDKFQKKFEKQFIQQNMSELDNIHSKFPYHQHSQQDFQYIDQRSLLNKLQMSQMQSQSNMDYINSSQSLKQDYIKEEEDLFNSQDHQQFLNMQQFESKFTPMERAQMLKNLDNGRSYNNSTALIPNARPYHQNGNPVDSIQYQRNKYNVNTAPKYPKVNFAKLLEEIKIFQGSDDAVPFANIKMEELQIWEKATPYNFQIQRPQRESNPRKSTSSSNASKVTKGGRPPAQDPRLEPGMDPKKAKRILANRESAARSKEKQKVEIQNLGAIARCLRFKIDGARNEIEMLKLLCECLQLKNNTIKDNQIQQDYEQQRDQWEQPRYKQGLGNRDLFNQVY